MRNFQRNILDRYPQDIQRRDYEFCSKDKVFVLNCEIISKIKKSGQEIVYDLINTGWRIGQYRLANWPIPVGDLGNTGWRFRQYLLVISECRQKRVCIIYMYVLSNSSIPVGDLANTGWRFGQYRLAIWSIRVGDLANTSLRFRQYRRRYIFQDLGRF